jgi:hypothetical protein
MPIATIIGQLVSEVAIPVVVDIIKRHREKNNGEVPTEDQIRTEFNNNIDRYLSEGAAWKAAHPDT